jgi:DNA-binding NtrC family response regulator
MENRGYDLVLLDLMMPDISGMEVLTEVRKRDRETPIFLITAYGSVEAAVSALKLGANDYFSKPWDNDKLIIEIDRMIAGRRLEYENTHLKRALKQRYAFPNIIGKSERVVRMLDLVAQVAPSRSTILITGETGTGKELVAKAIHANSPRADRMFVAVNSGSLPPDLLESTLFGHVKGAFTSAVQSKKGYFEVADGGTIFFDEIGTIGPETQIKLLRVFEEREFTPLGSTDPIKVDVRILAATNADLRELVKQGKFREDLYYRLNVIQLGLPPLRERREDIPLLVDHFFTQYCLDNKKFLDSDGRSTLRFQPEVMQVLMEHNWPGNVRELENVSRARRGAGLGHRSAARRSPGFAPASQRSAAASRRWRPAAAGRVALRDRQRFRTARDHRAPRAVRLEPDGSRRKPASPALHAESEDQAAGYQDSEEVGKLVSDLSFGRRQNLKGHGWTRIHADKKRPWFYPCESVSIRGQTCFSQRSESWYPVVRMFVPTEVRKDPQINAAIRAVMAEESPWCVTSAIASIRTGPANGRFSSGWCCRMRRPAELAGLRLSAASSRESPTSSICPIWG